MFFILFNTYKTKMIFRRRREMLFKENIHPWGLFKVLATTNKFVMNTCIETKIH